MWVDNAAEKSGILDEARQWLTVPTSYNAKDKLQGRHTLAIPIFLSQMQEVNYRSHNKQTHKAPTNEEGEPVEKQEK